jgi:hypothetical protein
MPPNTGGNPLRHSSSGGRPAVKVGELLQEAGLVSANELEQSLAIARESKQPVGRVLVGLEHVSQRDLELALKAQQLVKNGVITERTAATALKRASQTNQRLESILTELAQLRPNKIESLKDLLLAAEYVSTEAVKQVLKESLESGVPFGKTLYLMKKISGTDITNALHTFYLLNEFRLTESQAIYALRNCRKDESSLDMVLANLKVVANVSQLQDVEEELLHKSNVVTESDYVGCLEQAVLGRKRLLDQYRHNRLVSDLLSQQLVQVSRFVRTEVLLLEEGVELVSKLQEQPQLFEDAARQSFLDDRKHDAAVALLLEEGLVPKSKVDECVKAQAHLRMGGCRSLIACRVFNRSFINATLDCIELLGRGEVEKAEAIKSLNVCAQTNQSFLSALASCGAAPKRVAENVLDYSEEPPHPNAIQAEIMGWVKYPGFLKLAIFAGATPFAFAAILIWVPIEKRGFALAVLFATLLLSFVLNAFVLNENKRVKKESLEQKLKEAGETKSRLSGFRKKDR